VLSSIISICESYLDKYPTTDAEDEKLISDRALFGSFSRQQRMAVKLRSSEKKILELTIKAVQEELSKLPAIVSMSGEIAAAGRSFDTMGSKATVANAKSPLDWVEVKGPPTKAAKKEEEPVGVAERRRRRRSGGN
jgi:hypothetical protein